MKRLLITGASGFIGSACLRRLISLGFDEIHAVSRAELVSDVVRWHAADLLNHEQITMLLALVKPTHILHAAWEVTPRLYSTAPSNAEWLKAGIHMAQVFAAHGGRYFLGIGSSAEYGSFNAPCREDSTLISSQNIYGQSKISFCNSLFEQAALHGFSAGWLRVFLPYGPGDPAQRLIPHVVSKLAAGEIVETTHGRQARDFVHVTDIAELCARMLEREVFGVFNAGTGRATSVRDVIAHIAQRMNSLNLVRFDAVPLAAHEPMLLVADMQKTHDNLGFLPTTDLFEALDSFVDLSNEN